jgi:hypothetical protein
VVFYMHGYMLVIAKGTIRGASRVTYIPEYP